MKQIRLSFSDNHPGFDPRGNFIYRRIDFIKNKGYVYAQQLCKVLQYNAAELIKNRVEVLIVNRHDDWKKRRDGEIVTEITKTGNFQIKKNYDAGKFQILTLTGLLLAEGVIKGDKRKSYFLKVSEAEGRTVPNP